MEAIKQNAYKLYNSVLTYVSDVKEKMEVEQKKEEEEKKDDEQKMLEPNQVKNDNAKPHVSLRTQLSKSFKGLVYRKHAKTTEDSDED